MTKFSFLAETYTLKDIIDLKLRTNNDWTMSDITQCVTVIEVKALKWYVSVEKIKCQVDWPVVRTWPLDMAECFSASIRIAKMALA